jgi:hypothetical protein
MSRQTSRMNWTFPGEGDDPFFEFFRQFTDAADASGWADADNNNIIAFGTTLFTWDATSSLLSWDADFYLSGFTTGFRIEVAGPASATILDGQLLGFVMPRLITGNTIVAPFVASRIAESAGVKIHDRIVIGARIGSSFYFRNGVTIGDGEFGEVWERPTTGVAVPGLTPSQKVTVNSALHLHTEHYFTPGAAMTILTLPDPSPETYKKFTVYRNGVRSSTSNPGVNGHTEVLTTPFQVTLNNPTQSADDVIIIDAETTVTVA